MKKDEAGEKYWPRGHCLDLHSRILCCLSNYRRPCRHWIGASKHEGNQTRYGRSPRLEEPRSAASVSFRASNHEPSIMKPEASGYRRGMARHGAATCYEVRPRDFSSLHRWRYPFRRRNATSVVRQYTICISKNRTEIYSVETYFGIACNILVAVISRL